MEQARERIHALIEEGQDFTYENFSTKGQHGYPDAFSPEWVAWCARAASALRSLFGDGSAQMSMLNEAGNVRVLRNGPDKFTLCQSYILGALKAGQSVLENDVFGELADAGPSGPGTKSKRVFIVHGHDDRAKAELEALLTELGLEPIVLHRQPDEGQTVIEKFEKHSDVGYAFVLLTPDEVAYLAAQEALSDEDRIKERRARPNVIFEFGFFVGRLGRRSVCCLHTGGVALPSDVHGLVYKSYVESIEEVAYSITKELKARGYQLA